MFTRLIGNYWLKKPHLAMHISKNSSYFELKKFMAHYEKHSHTVIMNSIKVYTILNTLIS